MIANDIITCIIRGVFRPILLTVALFLTSACAEAPKPLSEEGEKLYPVRGTIISRDAGDNTLRLQHEAIPDFMEAMTMDFGVRGAKVADLPPDTTRVEATLHVTDNSYWITGVKKAP